MNDTKVVIYKVVQVDLREYGKRRPVLGIDDGEEIYVGTKFVTHADYRALQDKYNSAIKLIESIEDEYDNEGYRIAAMATRYLDIVLDRKKP